MKPTSSHGRPCNPRMGVNTVNMSNSDVLLRFVEYTVYPYSGSCLLRPPHDGRLLGAKHELPSTTAGVSSHAKHQMNCTAKVPEVIIEAPVT